MEGSSFQMAFHGVGYKEEQDPFQGKPTTKIRTLVQGPGTRSWEQKYKKRDILLFLNYIYMSSFSEVGYVATPIAMVQSALTILNEPAALPKKWVLTLQIHSHSHPRLCSNSRFYISIFQKEFIL